MNSSASERQPARAVTAAQVRGNLEQLFERGHAQAEDGASVPLEPHALGEADTRGIRELAVAEGVRATLEVGLGLGVGTLSLCEALLEVGHPDARHTVVEPFPGEFFGGAGMRTVRAAGVEDLVELVHGESQLVLPRLVGEGRSFDLALIDGDHSFEGVFLDLYFADRLVRPRGIVIADDLWIRAIRLAVSYAERNLGWQLLPEAMPRAFRWRRLRNLPGRRLRGSGNVAVLRRPAEAADRPGLDNLVPFT
jgi:predicted O-methyltransferase YrrM